MRTGITYLAACMLVALLMSSCTKSDLPEPEYYRVRLYDDTLPDPRTKSIHIAAGDGRLLMTYGNTFEQLVLVNGGVAYPPAAQNNWMLTDNEGTLIKKGKIPSGLTVYDAISFPDNSFVIITHTGIESLWGGPEWALQIMRIDPNGEMGPFDTLNVPISHPLPFLQLWDLHLCHSVNGNAVIYFIYESSDGASINFVGEMDMYGNFLWHKESELHSIASCVLSPDGGYMTAGRLYDPVSQLSKVVLMKTNNAFDSTWSKLLDPKPYGGDIPKIISAGNGNYWLNITKIIDSNPYSQIFEFNSTGVFVDSTTYPIKLSQYNLNCVMLNQGASDLFVSYTNDILGFYSTISDQFNSTYATLDADLNLIKNSTFQDLTSDLLSSGCRTSDGRIASFGITQSYDRRYYKPELIILN